MTERSYGQTWWGKTWVKALRQIDAHTNRLPRGRAYARAGRVTSIDIENGAVRALVQGSRRRPYQVRIALRPFTSRETRQIKEDVASNPAVASGLALGSLPRTMMDLLKERNIDLLPSSWEDIDAGCSCPDWANPCKHLAAVYYTLTGEIDQSPFLLFQLKGLTEEELTTAAGLSSPPPALPSPVFVPLSEAAPASGQIDLLESAIVRALGCLPEGKDERSLFSLLSDAPPFYPRGDFKDLLIRTYGRVSRGVATIGTHREESAISQVSLCLLCPASTREGLLQEGQFFAFPRTSLSNARGTAARRQVPVPGGGTLKTETRTGTLFPLPPVLDLVLEAPLSFPRGIPATTAFLKGACALAQALVQAWAFVPRLVPGGDGGFRVEYTPLLRAQGVEKALEKVARVFPPNLVFRPRDSRVLRGLEGTILLLEALMTHMVRRFSGSGPGTTPDPLLSAFFAGDYFQPQDFRDRQTPRAVSSWMSRLNAQESPVAPILKLEPGEEDQSFSLEAQVEDREDPLASPLSLGEVFKRDTVFSRPGDQVRGEIARQITLLADHIPGLEALLNSRGRSPLDLTSSEAASFLQHGRDVCRLLGIKVLIPRQLQETVRPRVSVRASLRDQGELPYLDLHQTLSYSWEVALGGEIISEEEFLRLVSSAESLVRFRQQYLLLDPQEVSRIVRKLSSPPPQLTSMEALAASLSGEVQGDIFLPDRHLAQIVKELQKPQKVPLPSSLRGVLRPYQETGYQWLYANASRQLGSCLADDMGLGKTVQAIALLLKLREGSGSDPGLVICPTSLIGNWQRELARFAPSLRASVYHGTGRRLMTRSRDVIITSYGILRQETDRFRRRQWQAIIVDEAQNIKNPESVQTRAVKSLKSPVRVALTGTPVENRLSELWSIMDFLNPGYLGTRKAFSRRFSLPVEKYRNQKAVALLRRITSPFILRRSKLDRSIIADLPEKVIRKEYCRHTPYQAALYHKTIEEAFSEIEDSQGIRRNGLIFRLMTALKQICNHPAHYMGRGSIDRDLSGKADRALSLLEEIDQGGEKALLFTQYRKMGDILARLIHRELGSEPLFFHGGLARGDREDMVARFQTETDPFLMIVSLRAGGTGLNLTAATQVIHYDLWWNPAVETQAEDRTYRIGQSHQVVVHRLITLGTLEEKIDDLMKEKRELAQLATSDGGAWLGQLSDRDLRALLSLDAQTD